MGPFRKVSVPQLTLAYLKRIHKLPVHKLCGCGNTIVCSEMKPGYAKKRLIPDGPDLPLTLKDTHTQTHTHTHKNSTVSRSILTSLIEIARSLLLGGYGNLSFLCFWHMASFRWVCLLSSCT